LKYCLDTHLVIWAVFQPEKLSPTAAAMIQNPQNTIYFSVITLWEIAIKTALGRADFNVDARSFRKQLLENDYSEILIDSEHAFVAAGLPLVHKDPFDRMLVAQAKVEGITLLTADTTIAKYPGPIQKV